MKKKSLFLLVFTGLMVMPRVAVAYLFYSVASVAFVKPEKRAVMSVALLVLFLVFSFLVNLLSGYKISPTAFLLALVMHLPFLAFLAGGGIDNGRIDRFAAVRALSLAVFLLSYFNMVINHGFPLRLPYIHYLPDAYSALFGIGGAKIVTIIGFFALLAELFKSGKKSLIWIGIALSNFIVPSYLIGIACGMAALALPSIKKIHIQVLVAIVGLILLDFVLARLDAINSGLSDGFGYHPKILALIATARLYINEPITVFLGAGIGQFASTAAEWGSDYLSTSGRGPQLPGLFMSYFHSEYLGPYLAYAYDDKWIISSSMNKPYTSISVIFAEFGFLVGSGIVYFLTKRCLAIKSIQAKMILIFCAFIFALDVWHDNFWFAVMLLLFLPRGRGKDYLGAHASESGAPL